jgi:hypothetical protein
MAPLLDIKPNFLSYGFIITRHVKCEKTNKYWNHCVKCIRTFYPHRKIVIIDDNSKEEFVKAHHEYKNIEIIKSEFPGRGELLPYYYYYKNKFFDNAVIIHDSVFFHKKINFDKYLSFNVIRLWHFNADKENMENTLRISSKLNYFVQLQESILLSQVNVLGLNRDVWFGCFGLQCFIKHDFLVFLQNKYNINNMLMCVSRRVDRCCLERIMGIIFSKEYKKNNQFKSIFGDIMKYEKWGYSFGEYENDLYIKKRIPKHIIKVWSGR